MPNHGSCLLGSINLVNFVNTPFKDGAKFNYLDFFETAKIFTRMLDNVVEINGLPLKEQRDELTRKRRHGMGILGLGSALAMMCIRYGSPEAVEFTENVMKELVRAGWEAADELSHEKGPAPVFEEEFEITSEILQKLQSFGTRDEDYFRLGDKIQGSELFIYSPYIQRLNKEGLITNDQMTQFEYTGPRFSHHTAIAPTGTLALTLGNNVSGGVEPSFAL